MAVSLLALTEIGTYLRIGYFAMVVAMMLSGILLFALRENKCRFSLGLSVAAVLLFIISRQPYAAAYIFGCLIVKTIMCQKQG